MFLSFICLILALMIQNPTITRQNVICDKFITFNQNFNCSIYFDSNLNTSQMVRVAYGDNFPINGLFFF